MLLGYNAYYHHNTTTCFCEYSEHAKLRLTIGAECIYEARKRIRREAIPDSGPKSRDLDSQSISLDAVVSGTVDFALLPESPDFVITASFCSQCPRYVCYTERAAKTEASMIASENGAEIICLGDSGRSLMVAALMEDLEVRMA